MVSRSAAEFADKRADFKCWLWIITLDHWNFVNGLYIFLTIYALLCSNVVVNLSDHNSSYGRSGGLLQRFQLNWAVFSAMSTIIAVQEQYTSNEGLAVMHMDHAGPIGGAIVHLCLDQWRASGAQTWCSSVRFQLNWAVFSAMSTIITVREQYASNKGLAMMHMDHAGPIGGAIVHLCLAGGAPPVLRPGARVYDFSWIEPCSRPWAP